MLLKALGWVTGLSLWTKLAIVLAVAGAIWLGAKALHGSIYNSGYAAAEAKCEAAKFKSQVDALRRDNTILEKELITARKYAIDLELQRTQDQQANDTLVNELRNSKAGDYCRLTGPDAERLRK